MLITLNGREYLSVKTLWLAVNNVKDLKDLLWREDNKTVDEVLEHLLRFIFQDKLRECETEEEKEAVLSETGDYIVVKKQEDGKFHYFKEFDAGVPVLTDASNEALYFEYRGMAEGVAEKLGEGWRALDMSPEAHTACKRLLNAILGEE